MKHFDSPKAPEFDPESLPRFTAELKRCSKYLEYGSGGSTVMADRLGKPTISIENDSAYATAVRSVLIGTTVNLIVINTGPVGDWGMPRYTRGSILWRYAWRRYATAPFSRMADFPDFVLVDGRFRVACALASAHWAHRRHQHAILMFDDYRSRSEYHRVEHYLGEPEMAGRAAFFRIGRRAIDRGAVLKAAADPL